MSSGSPGKDPYAEFGERGSEIRKALEPLCDLMSRDRAIFIEYHYFRTPMKLIAESHKISLGRTYDLLYRAEEKVVAEGSLGEKVPDKVIETRGAPKKKKSAYRPF